MKRRFLNLYDEHQQWLMSLLVFPVSLALWLVFGYLISSSALDVQFFNILKVLTKGEALSYLSILLAIQIPLFILFLERMSSTGHIFRRTLPQATNFREILVAMVFVSGLVLASPRESYLYLPVLFLIALNLFAIYRAATVIFQPERFESKNKQILEKRVRSSFDLMINRRKEGNKFYENIKKHSLIEYSFMEPDLPPEVTMIEIRASRDGYLDQIDLTSLSKIFTNEFYQASQSVDTDNDEYKYIGIKLRVLPSTNVKRHKTLAVLLVPAIHGADKDIEKIRKQMLSSFNIIKGSGSSVQWVDDLIDEFEQQLNKAITQNDTLLLTQTFELFQILLDQVDGFIQDKQESDYTLESAYRELSHFMGDEFSKRIDRLYEILGDLIPKSVRDDQPDINREIIRFIYRNILDATHSKNITSIARYDRLLQDGLGIFIYSNAWNGQLTASQIESRDSFLRRLKEHTDLLLYELRKEHYASESIFKQWFEQRLSVIRQLAMASYKNGKEEVFNVLLEIFTKADSDRHYDKLDEATSMLIRCNIFMLASYVSFRNDMESHYGQRLEKAIMKWSENELTDVLIECVDKNYADSWRVDTYDNEADGVMHMVPDYRDVHKKLWVHFMLKQPSIINDTEYYGDKTKFEKTLLFTNGLDTDTDNPLLSTLSEDESQKSADLEVLVRNFINIRREWETVTLANEQLDKDKIDKFGANTIEAYLRNSIAHKIFKPVIDGSKAEKGFIQTGINQVFDKQAFIKQWHIGYGVEHFGESLGEGIASNQDRHIFSHLFSKPRQYKNLKAIIESTRRQKGVDWLLVANGLSQWEIGRNLADHIDKNSDQDNQYVKGIHHSLPIQKIFTDDIPKGLYFVDVNKIGKLFIKQANNNPPVRIDIKAYSHTKWLLNGILKQSPEWLTEKGTRNDQEKFLKTKVRLLVERVFKYTSPRSPHVLYLPLSDDIY